jgi:polyisoprenoid-binding protein YceI
MTRRHLVTAIGILTIAVLALAPSSLAQQAPDVTAWIVDATHSHVEFSISKWTVTRQQGIFRDLEGVIRMDPGEPERASVEIRVRAASLDTRNATRDRVVRSDDFLDVKRHPWITFRSTRLERDENGGFEVTGDLTIRGVTRNLTAPVQFTGVHRDRNVGELAAFESEFTVNRRDFGVLGSRWSGGQAILGDEVAVRLAITARRAR